MLPVAGVTRALISGGGGGEYIQIFVFCLGGGGGGRGGGVYSNIRVLPD